ncbi:MAG: hypothetical protein M3340_05310, partial [Actinomycetota bacterium]|nr:hypothetical protein [Actinomycetota bacterium]
MRPSDYLRTTTERSAAELPPGFRAAVEEHAERVGAGSPLADVRAACVTSSEPAGGGGLFRRRKRAYDTWLLLGAGVLTVVTDASGRPVVSLYRLSEIEVKRFDSTLVEDTGLDVIGLPLGATERSSAFLPLDQREAGSRFEAELRAAVA